MLITIKNIIGAIRNVLGIVTDGLKMWLPFERVQVVGSEMIVGGVSSTGSWGLAYTDTTLSIVDGALRVSASSSTNAYGARQTLTTVVGAIYKITATVNFDNASGGAANLKISIHSNLGGGTTLRTTSGSIEVLYKATNTTTYIGVADTAVDSSNYLEIESISVKEVNQFTPDTSSNLNNAKLYTGKALSFDGVNDYVDVGATGSNANTIAITFVVGFNITHTRTAICLANLTGTGFSGIFLGSFTGTLTNELITIVDGSTVKNSYETTTDSISAGVHRLVMVYNSTSSNYDIYLDGVQKTLTLSPSMQPIPADNILLGRRADGLAHWFQGKLSDVQIYNTAWTQADVTYDYNKPNHLVTDNPSTSIVLSNLKGYFALSEGAGSIAYDSSGEANNGTIYGATYQDAQPTIPQLGMMDWAKSTPVSNEITLIANPNNPSQDILGNSVRLREHSFNLYGSGYAEVADADSLDFGTGAFTVECWVKADYVNTGSSINVIIILGGEWANTDTVSISTQETQSGSKKFLARIADNNLLIADDNYNVGQWYHVCLTRDDSASGLCTLYIDAVAQADTETTNASVTNTSNKLIGRDTLTTRFYKNLIDDVRLYNKALSADEVEQNYKAGLSQHKVGSSFSDDFSGDYGN